MDKELAELIAEITTHQKKDGTSAATASLRAALVELCRDGAVQDVEIAAMWLQTIAQVVRRGPGYMNEAEAVLDAIL